MNFQQYVARYERRITDGRALIIAHMRSLSALMASEASTMDANLDYTSKPEDYTARLTYVVILMTVVKHMQSELKFMKGTVVP